MNNKIKFLLSVVIVAAIALVVMPAIQRLISSSHSKPILKDVSTFSNKIADTNKRALPPPEQLAGYGVRIFDANGTYVDSSSLIYQGKPLKLYVSIANATSDKGKLGLMVFMDSEIVGYHVDDKNTPEYFYKQELPKFSLANIPITINLDESMSGSSHKLWFAFINKLDEKREENHSQFLSLLSLSKDVVFNGTSPNSAGISSPEAKGRVVPARNDISQNTGFRMALDFDSHIKELYQKGKLTVKKGETVRLRIEALGEEGAFATILFLDHMPVSFDDKEHSLIWKIKKGEMLSHSFALKAPENPGKYEMYAITLPLGSDQPFAKGSGRFTLEVEDK